MKNKNKKRVLFNFMPYECAAVEEFLEEEASKGWLLTSISGNIFKFEKIKARKLKFTVDILGDVTFFHAEDNEDIEIIVKKLVGNMFVAKVRFKFFILKII